MTSSPYLLLAAGIVCAGIGGELFVRGVGLLTSLLAVPPHGNTLARKRGVLLQLPR